MESVYMSIVTSSHGFAKLALSKELLFSFISIFKMNANGDPYKLQTADSEFKSKLIIFESISKSFPKINCLKSFFQNLETDEKFLLFNFLIEEDVESTFKYKIAIDDINKKSSIISQSDGCSVVKDYLIYCFGDEKRYIGRKKKESVDSVDYHIQRSLLKISLMQFQSHLETKNYFAMKNAISAIITLVSWSSNFIIQ